MSQKIDLKVEYTNRLAQENEALKARVEQLRESAQEAANALGFLSFHLRGRIGEAALMDIAEKADALQGALDATPAQCLAAQHPDDAAVDRFAMAMKTKLAAARAKGRSGWDDKTICSGEHLAQLLIEHLAKGNAGTFEDIANFSMMLHQRGDDPQLLRTALAWRDAEIKAQAGRDGVIYGLNYFGRLTDKVSNEIADVYFNQLRQQAKAGE